MNNLVYSISSTQRKLIELSDKLSEVYKDVQDELRVKKNELEKKYSCFDKDRILLKITQRMVYLNRQSKEENKARIDELSKLLDWMERL